LKLRGIFWGGGNILEAQTYIKKHLNTDKMGGGGLSPTGRGVYKLHGTLRV